MPAKPKAKAEAESTEMDDAPAIVNLRRLKRIEYQVRVEGLSPLIVNRWSEKAKQMMLAKQQSKVTPKQEPKDPKANFEASKYRMPDGSDGFPAPAFKAAIVSATRLIKGPTIVLLKQILVVIGEGPDQLVRIDYPEGACTMREDTPRNASGVADLRYRAQYWPWAADLRVLVPEGQIDQESLLTLVDLGGIGGIGEWRPTSPRSMTGTYGTYQVASS